MSSSSNSDSSKYVLHSTPVEWQGRRSAMGREEAGRWVSRFEWRLLNGRPGGGMGEWYRDKIHELRRRYGLWT
jgi:hypothetical protein